MFLFATALHAGSEISLKEVMGNGTLKVSLEPKESPILFLFGENCSYCKAQIKEFDCLNENKVSFESIILMKDERKAFKEKQKLNLRNKLYMSSEKFEESFQIKKKITPTIIIPKQEKFSVVYGKKTCEEILAYGKN